MAPRLGPVSPTTDLERAHADLVRHGYCIVADALREREVEALLERTLEQMEAERERGLGMSYGDVATEPGIKNFQPAADGREQPNRWVGMLVNKGEVFRALLVHPLVDALMEPLLGEDFMLSSYSAHITGPGGPLQPIHTDQWWMPRPVRRGADHRPAGDILRGECYGKDRGEPDKMISPPVVADIMWPLDPFTVENGATRIVPGSHLSGEQPDPAETHDDVSVAITGEPGFAIVFDGRTWHGAGANRSRGRRAGLLSTFCAPIFRQSENYALGTDPSVLRNASPKLLTRLGLKPWRAYGRVGTDTEKLVCLEDDFEGELSPSRGACVQGSAD